MSFSAMAPCLRKGSVLVGMLGLLFLGGTPVSAQIYVDGPTGLIAVVFLPAFCGPHFGVLLGKKQI